MLVAGFSDCYWLKEAAAVEVVAKVGKKGGKWQKGKKGTNGDGFSIGLAANYQNYPVRDH